MYISAVETLRRRGAEVKKAALASVFAALGVVLAPWLWFPVLGSKAYPGQHLMNAIAGVLIGPWWAALAALITGLVRMSLGVGTIYAMPGGIPGALVVGLCRELLKKTRLRNREEIAALLEPVGTVLIGGTLALYLVAPAVGDVRTLGKPLLILWSGWALSSIPGSVLGFLVLLALRRGGITRKTLFGEE